MALASGVDLFCISIGASALGGALGMASGIFIVPLLTVVAGVDIHVAIGASIVSVIACSCGSATSFLRERLVNLRLAIVLETATTLGAGSGVLLSGWFSKRLLYATFAAVLLTSSWQMLRRRVEPRTQASSDAKSDWTRRLDSSYPDRGSGTDIAYKVDRLSAGLALMYGAGLLSALLGIGSGVLKIPAMDNALRLPIKVSSATSNFMIGVTAAASAGAYLVRGEVEPDVAGPVALGSVIGAILGARFLIFVSPAKLRLVFVAVLLGLSIQMILAATGSRRW